MYEITANTEELKNFLNEAREEYSEELTNGMSQANYKRAIDNFEKKLEKMSGEPYQTEVLRRLQKNKKQELIVGAYTKKEFCKVYFNQQYEEQFIVFYFRYKVVEPKKVILVLEEDKCNYKKIIGGLNGTDKKILEKQNEDCTA